MVVFNILGFIAIALAGGASYFVGKLFPSISPNYINLTFASTMFILDFCYRFFHLRPKLKIAFEVQKGLGYKKMDQKLFWFVSTQGGMLMFVPVYILGIIIYGVSYVSQILS